MDRNGLIALLEAHGRGVEDAPEAAMLEAVLEFVRREPRCAERSLAEGHLTGSAWVVNRERTATLLTHHRKLDMWLQLGGHADGELDLAAVALREAREESGLESVRLVSGSIFDVDRHRIPARKGEPEHWHHDVRFLIEADPAEALVVSAESKELAWVTLSRISEYSTEASLLRMAAKTAASRGGG